MIYVLIVLTDMWILGDVFLENVYTCRSSMGQIDTTFADAHICQHSTRQRNKLALLLSDNFVPFAPSFFDFIGLCWITPGCNIIIQRDHFLTDRAWTRGSPRSCRLRSLS